MANISVIIITKNAGKHLDACLASVSWCNEIIIVDANSGDNTLEICQNYTDKIIITLDWPGFGAQKNRALAQAQGEWILSVDADEQVPHLLKEEIQQALQQEKYTAFRIPRLSCYCGRWIYHSGWQPDYVIRLFKRKCARFSEDLVHEKVTVTQGKIGTLKTALHHDSFSSLEDVLNKMNAYSSASAQMYYTQGRRASLSKAIFHGLWAFLRTYLLKKGFLDGREGFMLAVSNAEGTYYRYLKLLYLQQHAQNQSYHHHV